MCQFFFIFISLDVEVENCDLKQLPEKTLRIIEADSFWCTSKLLDGIQDNYTFAQPGIQQKVNDLKELMKRIDGNYYPHLLVLEIYHLFVIKQREKYGM